MGISSETDVNLRRQGTNVQLKKGSKMNSKSNRSHNSRITDLFDNVAPDNADFDAALIVESGIAVDGVQFEYFPYGRSTEEEAGEFYAEFGGGLIDPSAFPIHFEPRG